MQDLTEAQIQIAGESVLVTSWRAANHNIWWAQAPQYLAEWRGTRSTSRTEVIEDLASFLTEYIELVESSDEDTQPHEVTEQHENPSCLKA